MKKLYYLVVLLIYSSVAQAQTLWWSPFPVDTATHQIRYQGVVSVPGAKAKTLYNRAKKWHALVIEAATQIPLKADESAGLFIGKRVAMIGNKRFVYTMAVECQAEQYEYLFTDFQLLTPATNTPSGKPGVSFVTFPVITPLLEVTKVPASLTSAGEVKPSIQKMLTKANMTFEQLVAELQKAMENPDSI